MANKLYPTQPEGVTYTHHYVLTHCNPSLETHDHVLCCPAAVIFRDSQWTPIASCHDTSNHNSDTTTTPHSLSHPQHSWTSVLGPRVECLLTASGPFLRLPLPTHSNFLPKLHLFNNLLSVGTIYLLLRGHITLTRWCQAMTI